MDFVFSQVGTVDKDVVKVRGNEVVEERSQYVVDEVLKCGRGVSETEGHN